jgi:hypothetical protein
LADKRIVKLSTVLLIGAGSLSLTILTATRIDQRKAPSTRPPPIETAPAPADSWLSVEDPLEVPPSIAARTPAAPAGR